MALTCTVNLTDYEQFDKHLFTKGGARRKLRRRIALALGFTSLACMIIGIVVFAKTELFYASRHVVRAPMPGLPWQIATSLFGAMMLLVGFHWTDPEAHGVAKRKAEYAFKDHGFEVLSETPIRVMRWGALTKLDQDDNAFYLYDDQRTAYIVPKRAFSDQSAILEFENMVSDRLAVAG